MENNGVLLEGDRAQKWWINCALEYLPSEVLESHGNCLAIIAIGNMGACRVTPQYREREIILLSDWIFPAIDHSEGDKAGRLFIISMLHEIAHAYCKHASPRLDGLTAEQAEDQEVQADQCAIDWYNHHVEELDNDYLTKVTVDEFRKIIDEYKDLCDEIEVYKSKWHTEKEKRDA